MALPAVEREFFQEVIGPFDLSPDQGFNKLSTPCLLGHPGDQYSLGARKNTQPYARPLYVMEVCS